MAKSVQEKKAEAYARANGYVGEFNAPPVTISSAEEYVEVLAKVEADETRASALSSLGRKAIAYYTAMGPDDFRRAAQTFHHIATSSGPKTPKSQNVRFRAAQGPIRILHKAVDAFKNLLAQPRASLRGHPLAAHLAQCLMAFFDEMDEKKYRQLARVLCDDLGQRGDPVIHQIRAAEILLDQAINALRQITELALLEQAGRTRNEEERQLEEQAERELKEIEAEIIQEEEAEQCEPSK